MSHSHEYAIGMFTIVDQVSVSLRQVTLVKSEAELDVV